MQERTNQPKQKIEHSFDVTKHIRLVPPFQEKEVDKYFLHFEKVAENLNWPKEHWTLLLQSVLIGKAREIYTQLGVEQSHHYETVKELILKGYELVPEAYRQKFRNCKNWKRSAFNTVNHAAVCNHSDNEYCSAQSRNRDISGIVLRKVGIPTLSADSGIVPDNSSIAQGI